MAQDEDLRRKLNEALGIAAALTAVVANLPGVTEDTIKAARGLLGSLTPGPVPGSPPGSAPVHFATHALDRVESIRQSLGAVRSAGGT